MIVELTLRHVEHIAHSLACKNMEWGEPIPSFATRFPGRLESCLAVPFQVFGDQEAYPSLEEKAAIFFYLLIKNHPFQNGNKRIAVTTLLTFLYFNSKWLKINPDGLYNMAMTVAESPPSDKKAAWRARQLTRKKRLIC